MLKIYKGVRPNIGRQNKNTPNVNQINKSYYRIHQAIVRPKLPRLHSVSFSLVEILLCILSFKTACVG